ncbi:MAG TPA: efflux RND transporter periplasmic adaptor subunit [Bacteroidia bacterium]|jgi:membrane fusion protein (multidrug efflux system)|nr:efflux RND transporter periplasmic adaptor subunit [Bacteroidia bacterium]
MKKVSWPLLLFVLVVALVVIKFVFLKGNSPDKQSGPGTKPAPSNVTVSVIHATTFDTRIVATGTTLSNEEVDLKPEVSGKIVEILFKEGDRVEKGALLLKLNDADLVAQLKKLELQRKLASEKEDRLKKLLDIKGVSQEEYDAALNMVQGTDADMEFTKAQIAKTELRAPFAGVIGLKSVSEGSYVSPTVKIASMQQIDPMKIDFFVPEKYSGSIQKGQKLTFHTAGLPDAFDGQIYAIEPKIDLATRTLQLRAICSNKEGKIHPGAFANIELVLKEASGTILIPTEALVPVLKGQNVYVYKGGLAIPKPVETGSRTDTQIEITKGLNEGDTIITTGIIQLKPGGAVNIQQTK